MQTEPTGPVCIVPCFLVAPVPVKRDKGVERMAYTDHYARPLRCIVVVMVALRRRRAMVVDE
jgi:hypothetical protein